MNGFEWTWRVESAVHLDKYGQAREKQQGPSTTNHCTMFYTGIPFHTGIPFQRLLGCICHVEDAVS